MCGADKAPVQRYRPAGAVQVGKYSYGLGTKVLADPPMYVGTVGTYLRVG